MKENNQEKDFSTMIKKKQLIKGPYVTSTYDNRKLAFFEAQIYIPKIEDVCNINVNQDLVCVRLINHNTKAVMAIQFFGTIAKHDLISDLGRQYVIVKNSKIAVDELQRKLEMLMIEIGTEIVESFHMPI